jgi:hypothetical protein
MKRRRDTAKAVSTLSTGIIATMASRFRATSAQGLVVSFSRCRAITYARTQRAYQRQRRPAGGATRRRS